VRLALDQRHTGPFVAGVLSCKVLYARNKAEIAIQTLSVIAGRLPPRVLGLVMEWAAFHQHELMNNWELARQRGELRQIPPLE
jgi:hypothetical protein